MDGTPFLGMRGQLSNYGERRIFPVLSRFRRWIATINALLFKFLVRGSGKDRESRVPFLGDAIAFAHFICPKTLIVMKGLGRREVGDMGFSNSLF